LPEGERIQDIQTLLIIHKIHNVPAIGGIHDGDDVMKRSSFKNTALATILSTTLAACGGGGGGGVSVVFDPPVPPTPVSKERLGLSTDIFGVGDRGSAFISAIQKMSEDQVVDASEAIEAFEFVQKHNGTFDPSVLANYEITIDGQNMSLEKGWYALVGYTKKYYEGKEKFWNDLVKDKQFDDEDLTYKAIEADMVADSSKDNLIDELVETGKAETVSVTTDEGKEPIKIVEGDVTYGVPVISYGDWTETSVSHDMQHTQIGQIGPPRQAPLRGRQQMLTTATAQRPVQPGRPPHQAKRGLGQRAYRRTGSKQYHTRVTP
jgi:hypothetical protein